MQGSSSLNHINQMYSLKLSADKAYEKFETLLRKGLNDLVVLKNSLVRKSLMYAE